jgi:hypothetical protein
MILAASLAAIIAAACIGLYSTIARADEISRERTEAIVDMSRVHQALQRAARTMLLDDRPPAGKNEQRQPRISLLEAANGPRLELTLMRPPVLGLIAGKPMDPTARHTPMAGAFEVRTAAKRARPTALVVTQPTDADNTQELELWWTPFVPGARAARLDDKGNPEGMLVSAGIRQLDIAFAKTGENKQLDRFRTGEITDWNNVPAFVEVNIEMLDGQKASWMLEVAAQGGKLPGTPGAGDSDLPVALIERLRNETDIAVPAEAGSGSSPTNKPRDEESDSGSGNDSGPGANNGPGSDRPPRDPAEEARRLAEAFEMLNRLLAQLSGGGGGGGGDE